MVANTMKTKNCKWRLETMTDNKKELLAEDKLKKVAGGLIATFVYKCPVCGAVKESVVDTNSHSGPSNGGGWCYNCNVAMKQIETRI